MSMLKRALIPVLAVAVTLTAALALAAETTFRAKLTGAAHLPDPVKTDATGALELVVSADGRQVRYVVTVKDIVNPAAADLHLGSSAVNGPLVVKLFPVGGAAPKKGPFSGVLAEGAIDASDLIGPLKGAPLEDLIEQVREGSTYVNIHTNDGMDPPNSGPGDYRLGEIRGQIQ
jgi:CHRD domain